MKRGLVQQSGKKLFSSLTILLLSASVAHATKYRPPVVDEDTPEEEYVVPAKKAKAVKKNSAVTLTVPEKPQPQPQQDDDYIYVEEDPIRMYRAAEPKAKPRSCIANLAEYNAPENAHIKNAVGGSHIFTTWYDQNYPVSIEILPQGGAVVKAPGMSAAPRPVSLCVDDKGPYLSFDGNTIRLYRGQLRAITFKYEGYSLRFTTKKPSSVGSAISSALSPFAQ